MTYAPVMPLALYTALKYIGIITTSATITVVLILSEVVLTTTTAKMLWRRYKRCAVKQHRARLGRT